MHLFRCPDCNREHDEPAEATFVLSVVCLDCAFAAEIPTVPQIRKERLNAAA